MGMLRCCGERPRLQLDWSSKDGHRAASWAELFVDLSFVAANLKLSDHLKSSLDAQGFLRFVAMFAMFFEVWSGLVFYTTRFYEAKRRTVLGEAAYVGTLASLVFMGIPIGAVASGGGGHARALAVGPADGPQPGLGLLVPWFSIAAACAHGVLAATNWVLAAAIPRARVLCGLYGLSYALAAALAGAGAGASDGAAPWLWLASAAVAKAGPTLASFVPRQWSLPVHVEHVSERLALVLMLTLGEGVISLVLPPVRDPVPHAVVALAALSLLWLMREAYYSGQPFMARHHALRRKRSAGRTFVHAHVLVCGGALAAGVALKSELSHLGQPLEPAESWLLAGGLMLFLASTSLIRVSHRGISRELGIGKYAALPPAGAAPAVVAADSKGDTGLAEDEGPVPAAAAAGPPERALPAGADTAAEPGGGDAVALPGDKRGGVPADDGIADAAAGGPVPPAQPAADGGGKSVWETPGADCPDTDSDGDDVIQDHTVRRAAARTADADEVAVVPEGAAAPADPAEPAAGPGGDGGEIRGAPSSAAAAVVAASMRALGAEAGPGTLHPSRAVWHDAMAGGWEDGSGRDCEGGTQVLCGRPASAAGCRARRRAVWAARVGAGLLPALVPVLCGSFAVAEVSASAAVLLLYVATDAFDPVGWRGFVDPHEEEEDGEGETTAVLPAHDEGAHLPRVPSRTAWAELRGRLPERQGAAEALAPADAEARAPAGAGSRHDEDEQREAGADPSRPVDRLFRLGQDDLGTCPTSNRTRYRPTDVCSL